MYGTAVSLFLLTPTEWRLELILNEKVSCMLQLVRPYYILVYGYAGAYEINDGYLLSVH